MKRFYYAAEWGFRRYGFVDNVLVSVAAMYTNGKLSINRAMIPEQTKRLFVDSGGFSLFRKWGRYPFNPDEYVSFIGTLTDNYPVTEVAIMDLPCEPDEDRHSERINLSRIMQTIHNAEILFDLDKNIPWVPVLQGHTLEEYQACIAMYEKIARAQEAHLWAVGSLVAKRYTGGIRRTLVYLSKIVKKPLHAFGLSLSSLSDPQIFFSIESADTGTWSYNASSAKEKASDLRKFKQRLDQIMDGFRGQTTLKLGCPHAGYALANREYEEEKRERA